MFTKAYLTFTLSLLSLKEQGKRLRILLKKADKYMSILLFISTLFSSCSENNSSTPGQIDNPGATTSGSTSCVAPGSDKTYTPSNKGNIGNTGPLMYFTTDAPIDCAFAWNSEPEMKGIPCLDLAGNFKSSEGKGGPCCINTLTYITSPDSSGYIAYSPEPQGEPYFDVQCSDVNADYITVNMFNDGGQFALCSTSGSFLGWICPEDTFLPTPSTSTLAPLFPKFAGNLQATDVATDVVTYPGEGYYTMCSGSGNTADILSQADAISTSDGAVRDYVQHNAFLGLMNGSLHICIMQMSAIDQAKKLFDLINPAASLLFDLINPAASPTTYNAAQLGVNGVNGSNNIKGDGQCNFYKGVYYVEIVERDTVVGPSFDVADVVREIAALMQ